jgi:putative oxidoreductase
MAASTLTTQSANALSIDARHTSTPRPRVQLTDALARHAHWLPRVAFASVFLFHGIGKLADVGAFAGMMNLPLFAAWLVTLAELSGGLAVLAGPLLRRDWLTRLGGLAVVPVMLGAIVMVHWGHWSFVPTESHPMGGMEFQVVLLMMGLWFAALGNRQG